MSFILIACSNDNDKSKNKSNSENSSIEEKQNNSDEDDKQVNQMIRQLSQKEIKLTVITLTIHHQILIVLTFTQKKKRIGYYLPILLKKLSMLALGYNLLKMRILKNYKFSILQLENQ